MQPSTLNPQPSTLNPQPSTLNSLLLCLALFVLVSNELTAQVVTNYYDTRRIPTSGYFSVDGDPPTPVHIDIPNVSPSDVLRPGQFGIGVNTHLNSDKNGKWYRFGRDHKSLLGVGVSSE